MTAVNADGEVGVRKLTLTLGQSAHSVKMDPALQDQIDEKAFVDGFSAYMNQPFDLTYAQDELSFNVPRTHTLALFATEGKLSDISVELHPLFEEDLEGATNLLLKWGDYFDNQGLKKIVEKYDVPINKIHETLSSDTKIRSFSISSWEKEGTQFSLGFERFERKIFHAGTGRQAAKPVYKVCIFIRSINHGLGSRR